MGLSIIKTDRLLICPYHLACAIPMAAEGGKRYLTTEHTEATERIFLCVLGDLGGENLFDSAIRRDETEPARMETPLAWGF